jgi:hypothetical protein
MRLQEATTLKATCAVTDEIVWINPLFAEFNSVTGEITFICDCAGLHAVLTELKDSRKWKRTLREVGCWT